jgi:hypothetical protein
MTSSDVQSETKEVTTMSTDWIKRIAEDERKRDDIRLQGTEAAARKADIIHVHGQRLLDELRVTVERDIGEFRREFPDDQVREIVFDAVALGGGFAVHKPRFPTASLNVAPNLDAASVSCQYRFTPTDGLPPREDRLELMFTGEVGDTLQIKHHGTGQVFATADALSEYLLAPVLTGRPR